MSRWLASVIILLGTLSSYCLKDILGILAMLVAAIVCQGLFNSKEN